MVNSRDIVAAASDVYSVTGYESFSSAGNEIGRALASMKGIKDLDGEIDGLYSQLENIDALLNDFNVELNDYMQSMDFDDSEFRSVESRLDVINDIKGKYGSTVEEVFKYLEDSRKEYERLSEYDEYIAGLSDKIKKVEKAMLKAADALTAERQRQAENLCRDIRDALADLSFMEVLDMDPSYGFRDLNVGFSGGEKKKAEILQLLLLNPSLAILDETDSGLDVDAVRTVSKGIEEYQKSKDGALLIITHSTRILESLHVDKTHVLVDGRLVAEGDGSLVDEINENGFEQFIASANEKGENNE